MGGRFQDILAYFFTDLNMRADRVGDTVYRTSVQAIRAVVASTKWLGRWTLKWDTQSRRIAK